MNKQSRPIPDSYWVVPGKFLAGEYPATPRDDLTLIKLAKLVDAGVTVFIDLTEEGEYGLQRYGDLLDRLSQQDVVSVQHERYSIPDMKTPTAEAMTQTLDRIDELIEQGETIYVHCYGGIGRTGTVVGCHLVRHGMAGEDALEQIARWRVGTPDGNRPSPETDEQQAMVLGWQKK